LTATGTGFTIKWKPSFIIRNDRGVRVRVRFEELTTCLTTLLERRGFNGEDARLSARLFAEASRDGVASHGLNRFEWYLETIDRGEIDPTSHPEPLRKIGSLERWEGRHGPGNLNAWRSMQRAIDLAAKHGIGCVALAHTNHWMRGGTYGWQAANAGFVGMCWTNTIANLPPWGGVECRLGNNPMVIAIPHSEAHVVLDFAQSQFSFGKLSSYRKRGEPLPVAGGFDSTGQLTNDAEAIEESLRPLPIGMWKGAGLALVLDLIAAVLSGGDSTLRISERSTEHDVSQVFVAIRPFSERADDELWSRQLIDATLANLREATPAWEGARIRYPGEGVLEARRDAERNGVEVDGDVWSRISARAGDGDPRT